MTDILASLAKPDAIAALLIALAVFGTVISVLLPYLQTDKLETRLKAVTDQREKLRKQSRAALDNPKGLRRKDDSVVGNISSKLNLAKALEDPNIVNNLAKAGLRGPGPLSAFYFARMTMPFVGALLMFFYIFFVNDHGFAPVLKYGSLLFGAAAGFYAPNIYISNVAQKRQQSIMRAFPDALDMLLICVEAGMSIELGFSKVSQEVGSASSELAEEFGLTVAELSYLPERRQAYENLAKRTGNEGIKAVCMALGQAERYGTPLGDALRVMAKENRDMRMAQAEKKAAALPAQLTVPMILFFLPVLFLVVLGPAYIGFKASQASDEASVPSIEQSDTNWG
ncbi:MULTISPECIES: type II secretion system F family protein [unclassified Hyphomonas]|jgi:tight adherence protein C|uniref:Type II/IV secretion system protein TadC,associated with Flp pilus assembly n=2 Tax=root TaxID=1 RepID=A0A160TVL8_9ZZZZ|nr:MULTISPECIES: type II secretion system F family protein [unclassified Hyphomonas]MAN91364.1 type II secretion system protein [Hyphomonadaceae bacterium]MAA82082.1 type II secretion system protein [Hyphomonas sp.]MAL46124.1 type II secretion system protein [Hyphomonas sp.]MAX83018.1 type II secretion system protein [Hyphomonas sp.]MBO6582983.1 type II secretion system F family protein [Hyphomonas sp.]|tara:strand:- start:5138 stop:6157 length:1020 start_codon:yes stop_codon:yes gene_type:complete